MKRPRPCRIGCRDGLHPRFLLRQLRVAMLTLPRYGEDRFAAFRASLRLIAHDGATCGSQWSKVRQGLRTNRESVLSRCPRLGEMVNRFGPSNIVVVRNR